MCIDDDVSIQINDDVLGLIVLKSDLNIPSSLLSSWTEDDNSPCSWKCVKCNPRNGRVSELSLDGLGLSGKIGKGLLKLQHLKVLSLSHNNFSGNITPDLGLISSLERLNLSHNRFTGRIPSSFSNLSSVKSLDLSHNLLSGPIPDNGMFENCSFLRELSLAENSFEGPIPSGLSKCFLLNSLNLSNNHFSGTPDFNSGIWSLTRLRVLDLSKNSLSGLVPSGVSALHNLKELLLQGNQFTGPIPFDIGLCPHLKIFDLGDNVFTGTLPNSLRALSSIYYFSLSNNMLTGNFPQWIASLSSLEYLDFSRNELTGSLPSSIGELKSLSFISLSSNKLSGTIPMSLADCSSLRVIKLGSNSFSGKIPDELYDLGLEEIDFSHNNLVGSVPSGSSKIFETLGSLDLSVNNLTGQIPAEIGLFTNLKHLNLSWNNLQSKIPAEIGYFQQLTELDLRSSALHGSIPKDICESGNLGILQLDGNSLTGPIPEEIGNCSSLYLLSLSNNNLSGSIPESISKLSKLEILRLESNKLSGEIPQELGKLDNLLAVNISYNRLVGRLPVGGVFPSLDYSALVGNLGLCSPLLKGPCKMNAPKPLVIDPFGYNNQNGDHRRRNESSSDAAGFHHRMFLSISAIIAISAAFLIVIGVIVISLLNVSARRRLAFLETALESICTSSSKSGNLAVGKLILFESKSSLDLGSNPVTILNKAAEIGEGVFGNVYRVSLNAQQGSNLVAVKKLVASDIIQFPEDFDREVRILGKVRHPNLISLLGYYWTPQNQLLVMEYAPNSSLQAKLHERLPSTPPLSWATRFNIIIGTAKGLSYLHHSFRPPIIHYNIKPSNILLDVNLNPKISDFGLARLLTKLDKHVITNRFQSALGYVAPELACQSLRVNEKCDVYGFGILMLELVTGKRPVEYGEDNVVILRDHVRILLERGNMLDCIDPTIGQNYPEDEVLPVLNLALVCTSQIPSSRPSMAEVEQILQEIKTPVTQRMEVF
ncbi:hypothetical protein ACFE04_025855 [Oxalis oulophora]